MPKYFKFALMKMFPKRKYFLLLLIISISQNLFSQSAKKEKDSSETYVDNRTYTNVKSNSDTIHIKKIVQKYASF